MKQQNSKSINIFILLCGILAYILGFLAITVTTAYKQGDYFQGPLLEIFLLFPPLYVLIAILFFPAIIEELAFRGWIIKKRIGIIVSYSGILLILHFSFQSILLLVIIAPILFYVFFIFKHEKIKFLLLIFFTSILFGVLHISNYTEWARFFAVIQLTGLAIILCYIGLRFGFVYCIIAHFFNNLIAILLLTLFISTDYSGTFENKTYNAEISKQSLFDTSYKQCLFSHDTISLNQHITNIAAKLYPFNNDTICKGIPNNFNKYKLNVTSKNNYNINRLQLHKDIIKQTNLVTDTFYKPAYVLHVKDKEKLKNAPTEKNNTYSYCIERLTATIRAFYKIPLILKDNQINYNFNIDYDVLGSGISLDSDASFKKTKTQLKEEYGIIIRKESTKKATIIEVKER